MHARTHTHANISTHGGWGVNVGKRHRVWVVERGDSECRQKVTIFSLVVKNFERFEKWVVCSWRLRKCAMIESCKEEI